MKFIISVYFELKNKNYSLKFIYVTSALQLRENILKERLSIIHIGIFLQNVSIPRTYGPTLVF